MSSRNHRLAGITLLAAAAALAGRALAGRPSAAIDAERRLLDAEIEILHRRTDGLSRSLDERRVQTRRRLRTLYKMSQGGYLRLLAGAETPTDFFVRRDGVRRVVRRDLRELEALHDELTQLATDQQRLRDRERRALELALSGATDLPGSFPARPGGLVRPVGGAIVSSFGANRDPATGFDYTSDGVELRANGGAAPEKVRAIAAGAVRAVTPVPGLGLCVILDHGGGFVSLTGRLTAPQVSPGVYVSAGAPLADAAGPSVHFQLTQGGTFVDPAPWLARSDGGLPEGAAAGSAAPGAPTSESGGASSAQGAITLDDLAGAPLTILPSAPVPPIPSAPAKAAPPAAAPPTSASPASPPR